MNRGHLPAGQQPVPGGGVEMGQGPGGGPGGMPPHGPPPRRGGGGGGGGRHHHNHHQQQQAQPQHQQQPYPAHYHQPMYAAGYAGYGAPYYPLPPQYANGPMPAASYHPHYSRSPPSMQQYVPMVPSGMGMPPAASYSRPPQHSPGLPQHSPAIPQPSPAMPLPYQPPPMLPPPPTQFMNVSVPVLPQTPSSTQSGEGIAPPMSPRVAVQAVQAVNAAAVSVPPFPQHAPPPQLPRPVIIPIVREPFRPPLPWLSDPVAPFPAKSTRRRRKRLPVAEDVELPFNQHEIIPESVADSATESASETPSQPGPKPQSETGPAPGHLHPDVTVMEAPAARSETPSTQDHRSEYATSTSPTTPSSIQPTHGSTTATVTPTKPAARQPVPAVPVIPALPKTAPTKDVQHRENGGEPTPKDERIVAEGASDKAEQGTAPPAVKAAPKLWTGLFAHSAAGAAAAGSAAAAPASTGDNATVAGNAQQTDGSTSAFVNANVKSLAEALRAYRVGNGEKLAFIEPRGLINTGNMCYMNSILQVLLFCIPFYDFLDQASRKAAHSFKSETPLIDAMIMFMREFRVIDSAVSAEQLRRRLKADELEQFGEPFTPEFVYDAIRKLPRFAGMRRGHQQDAEEFLGFLLESLHEECAQVMRHASGGASTSSTTSSSPTAPRHEASEAGDGWLEVGPKQRSAVTRSSGQTPVSTPLTKIFGGQLRSELRVPGLKDSVTLEPYQPLQLDIGAPNVRNIVDALKGLTKPESLRGDFNSPRGKDVTATKTVYIESLPPVLILHLKRFQFDAEGNGTVKIWKKVGYPLELEIPREVFSRQKRNNVLAEGSGPPRYRLITVVYHHGRNASGGHYTVDARRQDGREWIRLDDTAIRRVHSDDVAEAGAEEKMDGARTPDSARGAGRDYQHHAGAASLSGAVANRFSGINSSDGRGGEDDADEDGAEGGEEESGGGWKQAGSGGKKWSSVVNGATAATAGPTAGSTGSATATGKAQVKENVKDNKVAYLLFYQRV